jgi:hypothetical protein
MAVGEAKLRKMGRMSEMFHLEHFVITIRPYSNVMTDGVFKKPNCPLLFGGNWL